MHKGRQCFKIFDSRVYFGPYFFGSINDKLFRPVFVFLRGMFNTICDFVLHL